MVKSDNFLRIPNWLAGVLYIAVLLVASRFLADSTMLLQSTLRTINVLGLLYFWLRTTQYFEKQKAFPPPAAATYVLANSTKISYLQKGLLVLALLLVVYIGSRGLFLAAIGDLSFPSPEDILSTLICVGRLLSALFLLAIIISTLDSRAIASNSDQRRLINRLFWGQVLITSSIGVAVPQVILLLLIMCEAIVTLATVLLICFASYHVRSGVKTVVYRISADSFLIILFGALLTVFYWWTVNTSSTTKVTVSTPFERSAFSLSKTMNYSHYQWQVEGFMQGKLSLALKPSHGLSIASNPYDPKNRNFEYVGDLSFYKGEYYSYFGVVPAVLIYLPIRALTGRFINDAQVTFLFATAGLIASLVLARSLSSQFSSYQPAATKFLIYLFFALNNLIGYHLRTPGVYEIAVLAGFFFTTLGLYFLVKSYRHGSEVRFLAFSSICFALSVGCRPLLGIGLGLALLRLIQYFRDNPHLELRAKVATALQSLVGSASILILLGLYNELRFGSWLEFGFSYILTHIEMSAAIRNPIMILHAFWMFAFTPPVIDARFPFIHILADGNPFIQSYNFQLYDVAGIFFTSPLFIVSNSLLVLAFLRPMRSSRLFLIAAFSAAFALVEAGLIAYIGMGVTSRYILDFLPFLTLSALAIVIVFADNQSKMSHSRPGTNFIRSPLHGVVWFIVATLVCYGALFSFATAFSGRGHYLKQYNPQMFESIQSFLGYMQ